MSRNRMKCLLSAMALFLLGILYFAKNGKLINIGQSQSSDKTNIWERIPFLSSSDQYSNKKSRFKLALVRPFILNEIETLEASFDYWNHYIPCQSDPISSLNVSVDLFLSFSQTYDANPAARKSVNDIMRKMKKSKWGKCFEILYTVQANIPEGEDLYKPSLSETDFMWVNGPNRQFEAAFRNVHSNPEYDFMFMMETDSKPVKKNWLDTLLIEIEEKSPFAILGSKYDGDSWDEFIDHLPVSLVNHLNGNSVYNMAHPLLLRIINQLEKEAKTIYNSIPYDYRISQIYHEGCDGVAPEIQPQILKYETDLIGFIPPSNTKTFKRWCSKYGQDSPMKQSNIISNFAATNLLPRHLNNASIIHGATFFVPFEATKYNVTLVVSEWHDRLSSHLLSNIDSCEHPFSQITLVVPPDLPEDNQPLKKTNLTVETYSRTSPDYLDICDAPVSTDWFMITNAYHTVKPHVDLLFTTDSHKPVITFTPSDEQNCLQYKECKETYELALQIDPNLDMVVYDSDILFNTKLRDEFCEFWKKKLDEKHDNILSFHQQSNHINKKRPTGTSYMAYLLSKNIMNDVYKFSSRTKHGGRATFTKVFHAEEELNNNGELSLERRMTRERVGSPISFNMNQDISSPSSLKSPTMAPISDALEIQLEQIRRKRKRKESKAKLKAFALQPKKLPCQRYCNVIPIPWKAREGASQKCNWRFSCSGCKECVANTVT